jgi:hypothetical protein
MRTLSLLLAVSILAIAGCTAAGNSVMPSTATAALFSPPPVLNLNAFGQAANAMSDPESIASPSPSPSPTPDVDTEQ